MSGEQTTVLKKQDAWAYLRVPRGNLRLAHADHLHLDLWWRGINIARDAGTFLYNGAPPWDNPFPAAFYHNLVTLNDCEPMTRAGRFLYLDWAQAHLVERRSRRLVAEHDGYRRLGYILRRAVSVDTEGRWVVEDQVLPRRGRSPLPVRARLHWLLPDWEVQPTDHERGMPDEERQNVVGFRLRSPWGWVEISVRGSFSLVTLVRAGEPLFGDAPADPRRGWYAPTYGVKIPALSLALETLPSSAAAFTTTFRFPSDAPVS